jgi:hypothetical protein
MQDTDQSKDRIAVVLLLLALVVLVGLIALGVYALGSLFARSMMPTSTTSQYDRWPRGPDIALPLSGTSVDVVVARLTLPDVSKNRHWFADFVMIVDRDEPANNVQIGLMRRPEIDHRLRVYMSYSRPGHARQYRDFPVAEGPHSVAIARDGTHFSFQVDAEPQPDQAAVTMGSPYVQILAQISNPSDAVSGIVSQLLTGPRHGLTPIELSNACRYDNKGLIFDYRDGVLVASGAFDPSVPSDYRGDCSAFHQAKSVTQRAKS